MAFCSKCGARYEDGTKFCPSCGAVLGQAETQQNRQQANGQGDFSSKFQNLNNTADTTANYDKNDIEQNKTMAILSYLSWLVLIPLFGAKESRFARFHVNQGIVLAIVETIWAIVTSILTTIGYAIAWWLGSLLSTIMWLASIVFFVMLIIGIMNAANGRAKELPVIGKFRILK